jgi:outer membrane protein OmpA-like peptidoglycan-associated protein
VLFDPGSAAVAEAEGAKLRALSATMRRLIDSVTAIGATLQANLVGRTDPTGSDATNQSLAQLRIDAVARRLAALGVPGTMLEARPLATSQPLRAATADEQTRINRSVSFEVTVANGSRGLRGP